MATNEAKGFDLRDLLAIDAVYANEVRYAISDFGIKIAYGESALGDSKDVKWHSAVFIPLALVGGIQGGLNEVIKNFQEARKATAEKAN